MRVESFEYTEAYKNKYGDSIPWSIIFDDLAQYAKNKEVILKYNLIEWQGFWGYLKWIESTIPNYSDYKQPKLSDHANWLYRILILFARAELEEQAVIDSQFGKQFGLSRSKELGDERIFHCGKGICVPDLVDCNGLTYDVKHGKPYFSDAHKANFIITYTDNGNLNLFDCNTKQRGTESYLAKPLVTLYNMYGLNYNSYKQICSEKSLEDFLGLNL